MIIPDLFGPFSCIQITRKRRAGRKVQFCDKIATGLEQSDKHQESQSTVANGQFTTWFALIGFLASRCWADSISRILFVHPKFNNNNKGASKPTGFKIASSGRC